MKSSEISTANSSQVLEHYSLPDTVKIELIQTIDTIKTLLIDNPEFFKKLISKCLLVGKKLEHHIYLNDIGGLIRKEYPDILKTEEGKALFKTTGHFVRQLCLNSEELGTITTSISVSKWGEIRDELDHVVLHYVEVDPIDIGLVGGIYTYE